jgi:hypothetical protein
MNVEELLAQARDLFDAMTQKRVTDYKGLVKAVHAGRKVKPEQIVEILDAVRKTPDDLKADVALAKQRDVWKAMIDEEPVLEARKSEINREREGIVKELDRRIREIQAEAWAKLDRFKSEEFDISVRLNSIRRENPKQQLIETSSMLDEVMAAHSPVPGAEPIPGMDRHDNIHSFKRERDYCAIEVRRIEREISEAEEQRAKSLATFGGSGAIDRQIAVLKRDLAEANGKLQKSEDVIANLDAAIVAQRENAAKIEALAIAE